MGCRPIFLLLAVTFTVFLMFAISIFAGGILNRIRGGYRDVGESWKLSYWEAHVVTRLVFAVPIGLTAVSASHSKVYGVAADVVATVGNM